MKRAKRDTGKTNNQIIFKRLITLILIFALIFGMIPMMGLAESDSLYDDSITKDESSPDKIIEEINEDDKFSSDEALEDSDDDSIGDVTEDNSTDFSISDDAIDVVTVTGDFGIQNNLPIISMGGRHSAAIDENGKLYTWGSNSVGQLGHGDYPDRNTPTLVTTLNDVTAVILGSSHSAAIDENGDLYTWGWNWDGQLGHGDYTDRHTPTIVTTLQNQNVIAVSLGSTHSAAITADGNLYTWGNNDSGQLGHGDYSYRSIPTLVTTLQNQNVIAVSLSESHSAAITADGILHTWGFNGHGQLGQGDYTNRNTPTLVTTLQNQNVIAVSLSESHSAAITADGNLHTWGLNFYGELGLGDSGYGTDRSVPTRVPTLRNVVTVSLGNAHSAAITADGNLHTWGDNEAGQLGLGDSGYGNKRSVPTRVPTLRNVAAVSLGNAHSAAITSDGNLHIWGHNDFGELGLGHTRNMLTPQRLRLEALYFIDNLPMLKSSTYNQDLAVICAELSAAAYDSTSDQRNIRAELEKQGFSRIEPMSYYSDYSDPAYGRHNVAHTFAERRFGNKRIVAIVIRGTYGGVTDSDWLSNLDIRRVPGTKNHRGFSDAMWRVGYGLEAYLGGIPTDGNTIYLITGHSRGGAVANLLAVHLSNVVGVPKNAVFSYNFAVPDNAVGPSNGSKWNPGNRHSNIFNICNSDDAVPYVPRLNNGNTRDGNWGKYGITLWHSFSCKVNSCPNGINHRINHHVSYYVNFAKRSVTGGSLTNSRWILPTAVSVLISIIKCPVDIQIYDSNDMLIAEIVDNELVFYDSSLDKLTVLIDGDIKTIITMDGEEHNFKITGTDTGTLDYSVSSIDIVSQSISVFKEFNDIPLTVGKQMTSAVDGDIKTPDVRFFVVDSSGNVIDEIEGQVMIPQPFGITLNKSYIAMQNGQTTQLEAQVTKPSPGAVDINWKSSRTSVATVDSNGLVTAVGVGTTVITAFNEELGIAAECRIDVTQDDVGNTVESVRLLQSSVTTNVLSMNYTRVPLQLVLPQNRPATTSSQSSSSSSSNIEHSITSVRLLNDPNNYFATRIVDDRFVELIPQNGIAGLTKITSLKTRLEVDIGDSTFTTSELTIRITRTQPKIRNNAIRFNSFFPDAPVNVIMTTSLGNISNVELLPELDYQQVVFDSENMTLSLSSSRERNPKRLVFSVSVEGFTNPIRHQVSTSVQTSRPSAKLNVTSVTMRQSAELRVIGQNISGVSVVGNGDFETTEVDTDGYFDLTYTGGDVVRSSTKLTLRVNFVGTEQNVTRSITVRPPPAKLGIKLSQSTITLNKRVDDDSKSILITTTPADALMSEITISGDADRFEITEIGKQVIIGLKSDTPTGTHRILFGTTRLTVKVVDANPTIRLSARGTFNIIDPNSTITLTPRFTNYNYTGSTPIIKNNNNFEIVSVSPSGVVTLRMSDNDEKPRTRQSITLTYDGWDSAPINITPRQVKPRLLQSAKQITLQANDVHSEAQLNIAVQTPVSARISKVEIQGNNANLYSIREIQNGSYAIGFNNQTISKGANIRLNVFFVGSNLPVAVSVRVVVS